MKTEQREKFRDAGLKIGVGGPPEPRNAAVIRSRSSQGMDSPLKPLCRGMGVAGGSAALLPASFSPVNLGSGFWSPEVGERFLLC